MVGVWLKGVQVKLTEQKLQVINNKHSDFKVAISFKDVALVETICCPKITIVVLDLV